MCSCDYEAPSVYCTTIHTARKQHICEECRIFIEPGQQYEKVFGVWDSYPATYKTCMACVEAREWFQTAIACSCWSHGNMWGDMLEDARYGEFRKPGDAMKFGRMFIAMRKRQSEAFAQRRAA